MDEELAPLERVLERVGAEARALEAEVQTDLRKEDRDLAAAFVHAQLGEEEPGAAEGGEGGQLLRFAPLVATAAALVLWLSWGALFEKGQYPDQGQTFFGNDQVSLEFPVGPVKSFEEFRWTDEELVAGATWRLEVQTPDPNSPTGWSLDRVIDDSELTESSYRPSDDELAKLGTKIRWRVSDSNGHRSSPWREATLD